MLNQTPSVNSLTSTKKLGVIPSFPSYTLPNEGWGLGSYTELDYDIDCDHS